MRSLANIKFPNLELHKVYFNSGPIETAAFAGIVHGVVVQITKLQLSISFENAALNLVSESFFTLKPTSIDLETLSSYSTSASARADLQS